MANDPKIVRIKSVEVHMEITYDNGLTVSKLMFGKEPPGGFPVDSVNLFMQRPMVPFFAHPMDMSPIGVQQQGPEVMVLRVEDSSGSGHVRLNDDKLLTSEEADKLSQESPAAINAIR